VHQLPAQVPQPDATTDCVIRFPGGEISLHNPIPEQLNAAAGHDARRTSVINLLSGTRIWLVAGITDIRNGFNGLGAKVQTALRDDLMSGHVFIFRGRNGSQVKLLWSTGDGLCLLTKRLERGRFA